LENIKEWLELIYFASGPVVVVIAYLALSQIKIAKEQVLEQKKALLIASKRDSLTLTSDQVKLYFEQVIPLQNTLDEKLKTEEIDLLNKFEVEFGENSVNIIHSEKKVEFPEFEKFISEFVNVANAMESFSTYFTSGVADEKVAYLSLGVTFCDSMKKISPILILVHNEERHFTAVLRLYYIWGVRIEAEKLNKEREKIERKLELSTQMSVKVVGIDS